MKIVFMGTPEFAVPCLNKLIEHHEVLAVVTQPDKPKGRGYDMAYSPCKQVAIKNDIPCMQPKKVRNDEDFLQALKELAPDLIVVVAFGQILPADILSLPTHGCINVHASLLPKLRGASPIHHAIVEGYKETGVTTMLMDIGLDTGDMLLKSAIPIEENDTAETLHDKLMILGANLLIETISKLHEIIPIRQNNDDATHCGIIKKDDGKIDWTKDSEKIINKIRGFTPWPSAFTYHNGNMLKIFKAKKVKGYAGDCGEVVDIISKEGFVVKCKDEAILILEVQMQGKKRMASNDFLRGYKLNINDLLTIE